MTKRGFGELEFEILNILKSGKRMTVKDVHQVLGNENKYNTVMTVMVRLAEKKKLSREKVSHQYEYWIVENTGIIPSFIEQFKKKIFGVKTTQMVSYLLESADDISEEDFAAMETMIKKARQTRNI